MYIYVAHLANTLRGVVNIEMLGVFSTEKQATRKIYNTMIESFSKFGLFNLDSTSIKPKNEYQLDEWCKKNIIDQKLYCRKLCAIDGYYGIQGHGIDWRITLLRINETSDWESETETESETESESESESEAATQY